MYADAPIDFIKAKPRSVETASHVGGDEAAAFESLEK